MGTRSGNGRAGGLHDEDLSSAHVLVDLDVDLLVVELADSCRLQLHAQILANGLRQRAVAASREDATCEGMDGRVQQFLLVVLQGLALVDVALLGGLPLGVVLLRHCVHETATGSPLSANAFFVR